MRRHLARNDLEHWANSFFDSLRAGEGQPTGREVGRASARLARNRDGAQG